MNLDGAWYGERTGDLETSDGVVKFKFQIEASTANLICHRLFGCWRITRAGLGQAFRSERSERGEERNEIRISNNQFSKALR